MNSQTFWDIFFKFIWILFFLLPSVYSQTDTPTISLNHRVFVILTGEDLTITFNLNGPANESTKLTCSYLAETLIIPADQTGTRELKLVLKNPKISGEYYCEYQNTKVYWFLCVRDSPYSELGKDYTEVVIVAVLTGVLLVFSVVGSVYVFRGHLQISKGSKTGRKEKQKKEEAKNTDTEDGNVYIRTAPSTSVYASLDPRTKSIYDELDCSAASKKPDQQRPKPRNKEANKTKLQSTQHQDEGQFECVYENY
ncbi:hypothetical protein EXN66_Car003252 [Channa argus]|uniref:Immunoglobulin subtype domain-containing protein n=1 Tax=Channa argus TaxID=215402 RepID=A0A6G1PBA3_CHAAH|nr:hypothetical protein EXN66_Car003252 [Channa argus]